MENIELPVVEYVSVINVWCHEIWKHRSIALPATEEVKIECPQCGEIFFNKDRLKDHNATVYERQAEEAKIGCLQCDEIFFNKDRLKDHNATVHERQAEEAKIGCPQCDEIFSTADAMMELILVSPPCELTCVCSDSTLMNYKMQ